MKHSIRVRLIFTLASLIVFTIFLCWFMNAVFLEGYYKINKIENLYDVYAKVNESFNKLGEDSSEEKVLENYLFLDRLVANENMNIYVMDLYENNRYMFPDYKYPINLSWEQYKDINTRIEESLTYINDSIKQIPGREVVKKTSKYKIFKVKDERLGTYYLELFGVLDNQSYVYASTNYQVMKESVVIANRFLAYVGVVAIILGIVFMFFISRSFTQPILELSDIAKRMSVLDFDAKYIVKRQDEIGTLGNSINTLSEKLENTISELKSANNELKSDIENKIQIDEMRKEFLSNVSHELKTPIALIQGYAEGLKENINEDSENRDFYCEVIMDEADKMNKMVKKLMSLNEIEAGNNHISLERFDIVSLIKNILTSSDILFSQKEVTLYFDEKPTFFVWADEYMVEEVFTNYISNALNHVAGEKIIEVKLTQYEEVMRVSVFNTGENIPESELEKVWVKFYKVDKARTREYGGNGIGLSIVKAIMNSMNRQCGVINHVNGVEFWFELDIKNG